MASLAHLRVLRLHLDFREAPHPFAKNDEFDAIDRTISAAVDTFASEINTLHLVCFLLRRNHMNYWLPYRVLREDQTVRVELDLSISETQGLSYVHSSSSSR